jgi:mRNA interferase MazF
VVSQNRGGSGRAVTRGEVWLATLDPTIGSETQKTHPCLIVSPPEMNDRLPTIIAAPMTTGSRPAPFHIPVRFQCRSGLILLEQVRALDKRRLIRRLGTIGRAARSPRCARCSRSNDPAIHGGALGLRRFHRNHVAVSASAT